MLKHVETQTGKTTKADHSRSIKHGCWIETINLKTIDHIHFCMQTIDRTQNWTVCATVILHYIIKLSLLSLLLYIYIYIYYYCIYRLHMMMIDDASIVFICKMNSWFPDFSQLVEKSLALPPRHLLTGAPGLHGRISDRPWPIQKASTWCLIPLSKWVITPVISGLTLLIPFITGVITHLLSGMSHQVVTESINKNVFESTKTSSLGCFCSLWFVRWWSLMSKWPQQWPQVPTFGCRPRPKMTEVAFYMS